MPKKKNLYLKELFKNFLQKSKQKQSMFTNILKWKYACKYRSRVFYRKTAQTINKKY
jgi:hypothetical protein